MSWDFYLFSFMTDLQCLGQCQAQSRELVNRDCLRTTYKDGFCHHPGVTDEVEVAAQRHCGSALRVNLQEEAGKFWP